MSKQNIGKKAQTNFILSVLSYRIDSPYFFTISRAGLTSAFQKSIHLEEDYKENLVSVHLGKFTIGMVIKSMLSEMKKNPLRWAEQMDRLDCGDHSFTRFLNNYHMDDLQMTKHEKKLYNNAGKFKKRIYNLTDINHNLFANGIAKIQSKREIIKISKGSSVKTCIKRHASDDYMLLSNAFSIIKSICAQNVADFKDKESKNRDEIIIHMAHKYPNIINPAVFGMKIDAAGQLELFKSYCWQR